MLIFLNKKIVCLLPQVGQTNCIWPTLRKYEKIASFLGFGFLAAIDQGFEEGLLFFDCSSLINLLICLIYQGQWVNPVERKIPLISGISPYTRIVELHFLKRGFRLIFFQPVFDKSWFF